jgi:hypothetical protein
LTPRLGGATGEVELVLEELEVTEHVGVVIVEDVVFWDEDVVVEDEVTQVISQKAYLLPEFGVTFDATDNL